MRFLGYSKQTLLRAVLFFLLVYSAAHAFCFFNLTFANQSVILNSNNGFGERIASGQYLQGIYFRLRGGLASPFFIGLLSGCCLLGACLLLGDTLGLHEPLWICSLIFCVVLHPALLTLHVNELIFSDATSMAILLLAAGIWMSLRRGRIRLLCIPLLTVSLALEPVHLPLMVVILLLRVLREVQRDTLNPAHLGFSLLMCLLAVPLYFAGLMFFSRHFAIEIEAALQNPLSVSQGLLGPFVDYLHQASFYPRLAFLLRLALLAAALVCFAARTRPGRRLPSLLAVVMVLAALYIPPFRSRYHVTLTYNAMAVDLLLLMLFALSFPTVLPWQRIAAATVLCTLGTGFVVFANQLYLKINLEYSSTLSLYTRILDRLESTPGYVPGSTPVAIMGDPSRCPVILHRTDFVHLDVIEGAKPDLILTDENQTVWYLWAILGYPANLVSEFEKDQILASSEYERMEIFPRTGCCRFIGDKLVVRISE